jgi:hypothetical protein
MAVQEHPRRLSRAGRRLWLLAIVLYGVAALADISSHLAADSRDDETWHDPANLAVAVSAGLFWPVDLIAEHLLSR